ncbi:MAG TPA: HAD-IC family P-type ATPase, partial [Flavobacteriales bacterium]|nr:HAD-IC family P-type ATPase [Flavobacteriales bacterium]
DLRPGDRIVVRDQELVPVDAVLVAGEGHIDNSFITGEPLPVRRAAGEVVKAGGRQRGAAIELQVLRAFADSHLKRLWEEHAAGTDRPGMPRLIDAVARRFTVAVVLLAVGAGLYWWGRDTAQVWPVVTAVLIVACPCALALSMPFTYGHTIRLLGRRGLFLRDAEVVERIASVDTTVFDKTGTLTERGAHAVRFVGPAPDPVTLARVRSLAHNSLHPLSAVLFHHLRGHAGHATEVAEEVGAGVRGEVDGHRVRIGSASFTGGEERPRSNGSAHVHVSVDGAHLGHFEISKRARTGMATVVGATACLTDTYLLTGDLSVDKDVADVFAPHQVRTGCSPVDKAVFVRGLQAKGRRVLMVGDGLNDAGALRQSDVGITVSETSAALTPASDAILDVRAFGDLPAALRLARSARRIVRASLLLSLGYNITGVAFAVSGQLTPLIAAILMPLSSVTVVGFVSLAVWLRARRLGLSTRN